jgi:hypothetical protein
VDKNERLALVVELMQSGFKQAAEGLTEYLLECHPDERHLCVDVIGWFEQQSGIADGTVAALIESGVLSK